MKKIHGVEKSIIRQIPPEYLKPIGILILILAASLTLKNQGYEAGSYAFLVYLMASLSLTNLLFPYKTFNWKHLLLIFIVSLSIELFLQNPNFLNYASK